MGIAVTKMGQQSWTVSDIILLFETVSYQLTTSAQYGTYI